MKIAGFRPGFLLANVLWNHIACQNIQGCKPRQGRAKRPNPPLIPERDERTLRKNIIEIYDKN